MPQLPAVFDSYPVATILDGSGNGTVSFQPNGCTVSISRLFVQVSTSTKQATVTLYKGGTNASNAIGTIVSGSTGGLASGQIFVTDGQTLYVTWTGGDAGATATATFSGKQVSFSEVGNDSITWSDPIAASDGSLVFPALKSPNYVAGTTGWTVTRDGNAEFNNVTVRGTVDVESTDGSAVIIAPNNGGKVFFKPNTVSGVTVNSNADIFSSTGSYAGGHRNFITFDTGRITDSAGSVGQSSFQWATRSTDGTPYPGFATANNLLEVSGDVQAHGNLLVNTNAEIDGVLLMGTRDVGKGLLTRIDSVSDSTPIAASTEDIVLTLPSATYKAGRAYNAVHNGQCSLQTSITNSILYFRLRKTNVAGAIVRPFGRATLVNTQVCAVNQEGIFTVGAADVTTTLVLTMSVPAGSTGTHNAGAGFQREVNIYDVGAASDYPNAPVLS